MVSRKRYSGPTHNERFARAQEDYLRICEENKALPADQIRSLCARPIASMYIVSVEMFTNYLNDYARNRSIPWEAETIAEKASDCATYISEQQLKHLGKRIERLSAYGNCAKLRILFGDKEREMREVQFPEPEPDIDDVCEEVSGWG